MTSRRSRPTSFRLPEELLGRLAEEANARRTTVTALVGVLLEEGLKTSQFPGIIYRDGPAGRRAGVAGGPDVWEVVRDFKQAAGDEETRVRTMAEELGLSARGIRLALAFYTAFPDEIDATLATDKQAQERVRQLATRRQQLLAS